MKQVKQEEKAWVRSWKNLSAVSAGLAMRRGPSGKRRRAERERGNDGKENVGLCHIGFCDI